MFGAQKTTPDIFASPSPSYLSLGQELADWLDELAKVLPVSTSPVLGLKEHTAAPGFL